MITSGNDTGWGDFQTIPTAFLIKAVNGEIDLNAWAALELANRGLDNNGKWIGVKVADQLFGIK